MIEPHRVTIAAGEFVRVRRDSEHTAGARVLQPCENLDPRVVVGEHGWWQGCDQLGVGDSDPFHPNGTNFNLTIDAAVRDPVSGTRSHRSNLCEVQLAWEFRERLDARDRDVATVGGDGLIEAARSLRGQQV